MTQNIQDFITKFVCMPSPNIHIYLNMLQLRTILKTIFQFSK